jgi:hypothetical protein
LGDALFDPLLVDPWRLQGRGKAKPVLGIVHRSIQSHSQKQQTAGKRGTRLIRK